MESVPMHDGPPGFAFLRTPGSREIFTLNGTADQAGEMGGIQHFGFVVPDPADIDRLIRLAKKSGGRLLRRGRRDEERYAFLADPDGHTIEIFSS
jgi:catechol 2,3-dioxygenase-like lactoylglutathione lyase family enzyme